MISHTRRLTMLAIGSALLLGPAMVGEALAADAWPSRPITMITPSSAGSGPDTLARVTAQKLSEALGQPVIVDNRPGGSGTIALSAVARAENDGYTFLYTTASATVVWPAVAKSVPYDVVNDFAPIAQTAAGGVLLLVNNDLPVNNLQELIDLVKASPGEYSYGTWAIGSSGHLMMEWLSGLTGMDMVHVPYRTTPQMLTELSQGVIKIAWTDPSAPVPFLRDGQLRGIAISGDSRGPQTPDIQTLGEQGYPFEAVGWFGMFAPAGTDPGIVQRLSEEVNKIQASPEMATFMDRLNFMAPPVKTPEQFGAIVTNDLKTWKKIATDANISLEN